MNGSLVSKIGPRAQVIALLEFEIRKNNSWSKKCITEELLASNGWLVSSVENNVLSGPGFIGCYDILPRYRCNIFVNGGNCDVSEAQKGCKKSCDACDKG